MIHTDPPDQPDWWNAPPDAPETEERL